MHKVLYLNHSLFVFIMLKCMIWKLLVVMLFKIAWPFHSLTATFHTSPIYFASFLRLNFKPAILKGLCIDWRALSINHWTVTKLIESAWPQELGGFQKKLILSWSEFPSSISFLSTSLFPTWTPSGSTHSWVHPHFWTLHTFPDSAPCTNCWEQVLPRPGSTMPTARSESLCLGRDLLRRWVTSKAKKIWKVVGT